MDEEQRLEGRLSILDSGATEEEKKKKRLRVIRCEPNARENMIPKCAPWMPSDPRRYQMIRGYISEIKYLGIFRKTVPKNPNFIKI